MSRQIPPPPPGFVIDQRGSIPPPPPGFVLDQQQPQEDLDAIRRAQAEKYPTAAERGPMDTIAGLPSRVRRIKDEFALSALEGLGVDPSSPILGTASNFVEGIKSIPQIFAHPIQSGKAMLGGVLEGPSEALQGVRNLDPEQIAGGLGQTGGTMLGLYGGGRGLRAAPKAPQAVRQGAGRAADALESRSTTLTERALHPVSMEHKARTQEIAPALAKERQWAVTGKRLDTTIKTTKDLAGSEIRRIEQSIPETTKVSTQPILARLDDVVADLAESKLVDNRALLREMNNMRNRIQSMGPSASFKDLLRERRSLDKFVEEAGGFKVMSHRDANRTFAHKTAADIIRNEIGKASPELAKANEKFNLYKLASDVIDRRELGSVGAQDPWIAGLGRISDDLLASYIGHSLGGAPGAAAAATANILRQSRGLRSMESAVDQTLARALRTIEGGDTPGAQGPAISAQWADEPSKVEKIKMLRSAD